MKKKKFNMNIIRNQCPESSLNSKLMRLMLKLIFKKKKTKIEIDSAEAKKKKNQHIF